MKIKFFKMLSEEQNPALLRSGTGVQVIDADIHRGRLNRSLIVALQFGSKHQTLKDEKV